MTEPAGDPSTLTYRDRRRLAALGRQLATEDPAPAAALSRPAARASSPVEERVGGAMFWTGGLLFLAGVLLAAGLLLAMALLLMAASWLLDLSRLEET